VGKVKLEGATTSFSSPICRARAAELDPRGGQGNGALEIGSVDSRRMFVPRTDDVVARTERKRVEDAIEKLKTTGPSCRRPCRRRDAESPDRQPGAAADAPGTRQRRRGARARLDAALRLIGQRLAEAQKTILDTQIKVRDVDRRIKDLEGKLASLAPAQEERTEVKVFVNAGAPWRRDVDPLPGRQRVMVPFYDARLATGTRRQAPSSNWCAARASSSARERAGTRWRWRCPPPVRVRDGRTRSAAVTIDYESEAPPRPVASPAVGAARSMTRDDRAAEVVEGDSRQVGTGPEPSAGRGGPRQGRDAGFQAVYAIAGRVTVRPRVRPSACRSTNRSSTRRSRCAPCPSVRRRPSSTQDDERAARRSCRTGCTVPRRHVRGNGRLPCVTREEHELGFGVDDAVRVRHAIAEEKRAESGSLRRRRPTRAAIASPSRTCTSGHPVTVIDQIPVSQNADIKIELLGKTVPTKRDMDDKRACCLGNGAKPDEEKVVESAMRHWPPAGRSPTPGLVAKPVASIAVRRLTPPDGDERRFFGQMPGDGKVGWDRSPARPDCHWIMVSPGIGRCVPWSSRLDNLPQLPFIPVLSAMTLASGTLHLT